MISIVKGRRKKVKESKREPDPLFKSNVYYDVVIKYKEYKGWKCDYVGRPTMHFRKGTQEIRIRAPKLDGWMEYCWNKFLSDIGELKHVV